jgi:hypothetical protein
MHAMCMLASKGVVCKFKVLVVQFEKKKVLVVQIVARLVCVVTSTPLLKYCVLYVYMVHA